MSYPDNYLKYPKNVLEPRQIIIDDSYYTIYQFRFKGLNDLYNFLKSNPKINREVWYEDHLISSMDRNTGFHGKPYNEAVEDLISGPDEDYKRFLTVEKKFDANSGLIHKYETKKEIAGGKINIPAYTAGSPLCYTTSKIITKPKFITVNVTLSYNCTTTQYQVFNRAIIITSLISSLEKAGYTVNVNAFELDEKQKELFCIIFELKRYGEKTNYPALYKSLCKIEFLRRICFRILEVSNVKEKWCKGYGKTCDKEMVEKVLKINGNDIYFDQPTQMGIKGISLTDDFEKALKHLQVGEMINIEKAVKEFEEKAKTLKKGTYY